MLKLTRAERLELDLLDSGRSHDVALDREFAVNLLRACHRRLPRLRYKLARDQVLEDAYIVGAIKAGDEWNAYKDFIDRRFLRRAREALKLKHRPSPPLEAYEDGHH